MTKRKQPYEFDVSISVAGEERPLAKSLAELLRAKGLSVFYDEYYKARLWGKDEREFEKIYGPLSRFVAPFVSKHYVRKKWTRFEFDTALREEATRDSESILPIRVDDSRLPGLHDGRFYLSVKDNTIAEIAACIFEKSRPATRSSVIEATSGTARRMTRTVAILSSDAKRALGVIVVSKLPLPLGFYASLFPDIDWKTHCRILKKYKLIGATTSQLTPSRNAVKAIRSDNLEWQLVSELWSKRLEELREHYDIAMYLAVHYASERRWDEAVVVLADVANNGLYGGTNESYYDFLQKFSLEKVLRGLKPLSRIKLYHALAICAAHNGDFPEALNWFANVRRESTRARDKHWIGQYYLNSGVALDLSGDSKRATKAFEKAIEHGKKYDEPSIVGRSLGNLAQIKMRQDEPDAAIDLMRQSTAWKRKAGDPVGCATSVAQLGSIEANRGNLQLALKHFSEAEALFAEQGMTYEQAKTAFIIGNVYVDLGQHGNALKAYRRAHRLANDEDCLELRLLAFQGIGKANHLLGRFEEIEREFQELLNAPSTKGHSPSQLTAYHGLGLAQMFLGRHEVGRTNLKRALYLARKYNEPQWAVKALVGMAGTIEDGALRMAAGAALARLAAVETRRQWWPAAARLWNLAGDSFARDSRLIEAEQAFCSATQCYRNSKDAPETIIASFFKLYAWRWQCQFYDRALETLEQAESVAAIHEADGELLKVIDERGLALQKLGRLDEAISLHERAVRLAHEKQLPTQLRISLNNQGQALRRLRRYDDAFIAFDQAEDLARQADEYAAALGTMINHGLALEEHGNAPGASSLLRKARDEAKRRGLLAEYATSLEALGNLAWRRSRLDDAEKLYRQALGVAKGHNMPAIGAEIAVNLASLLATSRKPKPALRLLEKAQSYFAQMNEPYVCHEKLAALYQTTGNNEAAKAHWELARDFALAMGNKDYVAICSSNLAGLYFETKDYAAAEKDLETAIANEADIKLQVPLLTQLLRVQLAQNNEAKAQPLFQQINEVANAHNLHEVIVDVHVHAADFDWRGDKESKLAALKAYLVALVETLAHLGERASHGLVRHIVSKLRDPSHAPSESDFDSLLDDLRKVLPHPTKGKEQLTRMLMWPFETARRLLPPIGNEARLH
jgi:tetratricopeptide (TPR) repeat protein